MRRLKRKLKNKKKNVEYNNKGRKKVTFEEGD